MEESEEEGGRDTLSEEELDAEQEDSDEDSDEECSPEELRAKIKDLESKLAKMSK